MLAPAKPVHVAPFNTDDTGQALWPNCSVTGVVARATGNGGRLAGRRSATVRSVERGNRIHTPSANADAQRHQVLRQERGKRVDHCAGGRRSWQRVKRSRPLRASTTWVKPRMRLRCSASTSAPAQVPFGRFDHVLMTKHYSRLTPACWSSARRAVANPFIPLKGAAANQPALPLALGGRLFPRIPRHTQRFKNLYRGAALSSASSDG